MNHTSPRIWTARVAAALGFLAQALTAEIQTGYLVLCGSVWVGSFVFDRFPPWQEKLRAVETAAVSLFVLAIVVDFFVLRYSLFVTIANFLLLFQTFKLLGLKERKDTLQMVLLSFFQILSACTLSVDIWQGIVLLLWIPTAAAGLFWQQISLEVEKTGIPMPAAVSKPFRRLLTIICVAAIPLNIILAAGLFLTFPRLAFRGAFMGFGSGRSGYNEQVNLGDTGILESNNKAVLWLEILPKSDRDRWTGYLRGSTLDSFDGKKWSRTPQMASRTVYADVHSSFQLAENRKNGLRQGITLIHPDNPVLFGAPFVGEVLAPLATLQYFADGSVRWTRGFRKPLRYEVVSYNQLPLIANSGAGTPYLQLPSQRFDQTRGLLQKIATGRTGLAKAGAIEDYLRTNYRYSLDLGSSVSENPVEDFLFVRRHGPCGHFASAMALMLRLEGIPSRVVAGYLKGSWNSRVGQFLIRETHAHAWVEGYFPNRGWVTFDPSPRVITGSSGELWRVRVQEYWQYLNYRWDRSVVEYDLYSQWKVVEEVQMRSSRTNATLGQWMNRLMGSQPSRSAVGARISFSPRLMLGIVVSLVVGVIFYTTRRKRRSSDDPATAFYRKFLRQMARKGWPKRPDETAWEFAERLKSLADFPSVQELTGRYYLLRFGSSRKTD